MAETKSVRARTGKPMKKKDRAAEIANTFEWLITAFILAFVFRAFVMEAFRIPTGSMADTLKGAHFRLRCPQCGYRYDYGFVPKYYGQAPDTIPPGPVPIRNETHCPNCGYDTPQGEVLPVANGDRILVLKCIYQFLEPERWDVIVFKNPVNPQENYIKRLVGLPGETLEIIDGDLYVNGLIARKPPAVQKELWMPIYNHDFQPVNPNERAGFDGLQWRPPFNLNASAWHIGEDNPTLLVLDVPPDETSTLIYGGPTSNGFETSYAYNDVSHDPNICSDLMIRFYFEAADSAGRIGATLSKYGVDYRASLDLTGEMILTRVENGREREIQRKKVQAPPPDAFTLFKFANVDHQLLFEFDGNKLYVDLGQTPDALERPDKLPSPRAEIFGSGRLALSHVALFRDIFYTNKQGSRRARAGEKDAFQLNEDEFFVLGDNSPNSEDARWWPEPDMASRGWDPPRAGIVPRYYLVGRALFVYWPSGFEFPWPQSVREFLLGSASRNGMMRLLSSLVTLRWIPNVGQMRFIYGGEDERPELLAPVEALQADCRPVPQP